MTISAKTSTNDLIQHVIKEQNCSYEDAIRLLMKVAQKDAK